MSNLRKMPWNTLLLATVWLAAFVGTHLPRVPDSVGKVSDKTLHFSAYAVLSFLFSWVLIAHWKRWYQHFLVVALTLAIYAAVDELLQIPVGRDCDVQDWIADMIGMTSGWIAFQLLRGIVKAGRPTQPGTPDS